MHLEGEQIRIITKYLKNHSLFFNTLSIFAVIIFHILKSLLIGCNPRDNDVVLHVILCKILQVLFTRLNTKKNEIKQE